MTLTEAQYQAAFVNRGTCLFPASHPCGHDADLTFTVAFTPGVWVQMTEAEIIAYMEKHDTEEFVHTSQWDFWYEEV